METVDSLIATLTGGQVQTCGLNFFPSVLCMTSGTFMLWSGVTEFTSPADASKQPTWKDYVLIIFGGLNILFGLRRLMKYDNQVYCSSGSGWAGHQSFAV